MGLQLRFDCFLIGSGRKMLPLLAVARCRKAQYISLVSITAQMTAMTDIATAKLFKHGRSQAVRLPKEFRLPGKEVRVRRIGRGVLLEPLEGNRDRVKAIFAEIDRLGGAEFLPEGRPEQPPMPPPQKLFKE
jgi:antitoxin VapB